MAPLDNATGSVPPTTMTSSFSQDQLYEIVAFERTGASLSITGVMAIFLAYALFHRLRTVPNTFIVFASVANLGASTACLIGYSGVLQGASSPLCQAQAFMFELFMQSDPWWSFAMAINVYMVFFFSANPRSFLKYWWAYCVACYGIPFIPALWLLLIRNDPKGEVYGNATIWCWIDNNWTNLRIYTYYLPIWVCLVLSCCIYIAVGIYVFQQRNQLRNISLSNPTTDQPTGRDSGEKTLSGHAAGMGTVATEVVQTRTPIPSAYIRQDSTASSANWFEPPVRERPVFDGTDRRDSGSNPYRPTTSITATPRPKESLWTRICHSGSHFVSKFKHMDPVKLAYLRTSFVFAISVLITWTPSSINRVHDLIYVGHADFGLNLASSIVLPLQGLWNAIIFFSTSWSVVKEEVHQWRDTHRGLPRGYQAATALRGERQREQDLAVELERHQKQKKNKNKLPRDDAFSDVSSNDPSIGISTVRVFKNGPFNDL